jgi:hypothetical protein
MKPTIGNVIFMACLVPLAYVAVKVANAYLARGVR